MTPGLSYLSETLNCGAPERLTKPAKASVAFDGLKQQQWGTDSHRRSLEQQQE